MHLYFTLWLSLKHTKLHMNNSLCPNGSFLQSLSDLLQWLCVSEQLFQLQTLLTPSGGNQILSLSLFDTSPTEGQFLCSYCRLLYFQYVDSY